MENIQRIERVALYCRVSTEEQKRKEGIADQLQALRRWAQDNGYAVCGEYLDEGYSARKSYKSRPALQELLAAVERNEISLIAFTRLDRWFRNIADYYKTQEVLDRHNCRWQAITEDYETVTTSGKFKVSIMLAVAEHEANQVSDRMRFTFSEKRKRGEYIGGTLPIGYKRDGKMVIKDPETAPAVDLLFRTYLETKSQSAAMQAAAEIGFVRPQQYISRMFRKCEKSHAGTVSGVPVEPYITPEQAAQIVSYTRTFARQPKADFVFSGLLICGECGRIMSGHNNYTSKYRHNKTKTYNCQNRYFFSPPKCTNSANIREAQVEGFILDAIEPALNAQISAAVSLQRQQPKRTAEATRKRLLSRRERLLDAYLDGTVSKEVYRQKDEAIEAELASLKKDRDPVTIPQQLPPNWEEIYLSLDTIHRHAFWASTISSITVYADKSMEINFTPL